MIPTCTITERKRGRWQTRSIAENQGSFRKLAICITALLSAMRISQRHVLPLEHHDRPRLSRLSLLSRRLPRLRPSRLHLPLAISLLPLALPHSRRSRNSLRADICTVALLRRAVDNALVQLAAWCAGRERRGLVELSRLVCVLGLGGKSDGVGAIWVDADGLVIDEAFVFAAVLVQDVERVAGELDFAGGA